MELSLFLRISLSICLLGVFGLFLHLFSILWLKPERRKRVLQRQGIGGPTPSFPYGNIPEMTKLIQQSKAMESLKVKHVPDSVASSISHTDWPSILFPYFEDWRSKYGRLFLYYTGNIQLLHVNDPDVVRDMNLCTALELGKPDHQGKERRPLFGDGIFSSSGKRWAQQRKVIAQEFYTEKIKGMINLMVETTESSLLRALGSSIEENGGITNIRVHEVFRSVSADILARACFGSSYSKGEEIFLKIRDLQRASAKQGLLIGIPGVRFIPSKTNRESWRLEEEVRTLILKVVRERQQAGYEKDLLQMILESANNENQELDESQFIVDNCKNIYFAGYETISATAAWSLMLLALHPEWQDRARAEVVDVYNGQSRPDADILRKMKTLTMVINETLRLYPPVPFISRETYQDMKFGDVHIPQGVAILIPVSTFHHDPDIWGHDAHVFNPERFKNGILSACKLPHTYMPFGLGLRVCAAQNFAMMELKVMLSLIILNFSFSLSPNYHHSPAFRLVIEPGNEVELLFKRV